MNRQGNTQHSMKLFEWTMLITLSLLWGGSFFFNSVAVQEIPVLTVVFGRVSIAAMVLFLFLKITKTPFPVTKSVLIAFLFMGFANNLVPFSLIVAGQTQIGSGLAAVLNATTPLFTAVVAHSFTQDKSERLTPQRIMGVFLGILGVAMMVGPDIGNIGLTGPDVVGQFAILGAALSYGVAAVFGRRFSKMGISPMATATGQVSGTTILMLPLVLMIDKPWEFLGSVSAPAIWSVIGLAVLCTAIAYILYFRLIASAGATNASLVTLVIPLSAILLGVAFLGETLEFSMIVGMTCIGGGLLVIDGRLLKAFTRKQPGNLPG